jgi:protoporphyrinogen IX oxidase
MEFYYLYFKAAHLIFMVAWMAALLYLPRLFVYHTGYAHGSEADTLLALMEKRLQRIIMTPAMVLTFLFGGLLIAANPQIMQQGWIHAKLGLVLALAGYHGFLCVMRRKFVMGKNTLSSKMYRILNEVPTVIMIVIIVLAVLKPF